MNLWKRLNELTVTKKLRMAYGAVITSVSSAGVETDVSLSELGVLDGVTAGTVTASKAVVVDANKDIATFRNVSAGNVVASGDVQAATANIGGTTLDGTDAAKIDGVTNGTATANKAVVVDANKDFAGMANLRITGTLRYDNVTTGVTAQAGGVLANATQLVQGISVVSTVASANDAVKLPVSDGNGRICVVVNDAANAIQVFPAVNGQIDRGSANASVSNAGGTTAMFIETTSGRWRMVKGA